MTRGSVESVPITVGYDVTALAQNRYGGIPTVCQHTLQQAAVHPSIRPLALFRRGRPDRVDFPGVKVKPIGLIDRFFGLKYDILHALGHRMPTVRSNRTVYTLHDAWSLYRNRYQSPAFQRKVGVRMARELALCDAVVSVSRATHERLLGLNLVDPERCHVVPNGVAPPKQPSSHPVDPRLIEVLERRYVLFVGRIEVRKNLEHIVEAVEPIKGLDLVIVGRDGYGGDTIRERTLSRLASGRLHVLESLTDSDLDLLYRSAFAAAQPSWEEGFGLPILEAMVRGCPVITSNVSACAEVAGEAAALVDPDEPDQSRRALERMFDDNAYRESLIKAGEKRAAKYSWADSFAGLVEIYRGLL